MDMEKISFQGKRAGSEDPARFEFFAQLTGIIKNTITSGTLRVGDLLPSEAELCDKFEISRNTVRQAIGELEDEGLVDADSVVELLENKIALIVPKDSTLGITGFEDITKAEKIALGDPESVPVGQYAKEAFENLGMWDDVETKTSFGTNVTEVLSWVAAGSADAGIVYLTDATTSDQFDQVKVIGYAPEGSVSKVIYPVGVVSASTKKDAAQKFVDYLGTDDALSFFAEYGFTANK